MYSLQHEKRNLCFLLVLYPISFHFQVGEKQPCMHEHKWKKERRGNKKLCSIECVQNVKGMENLTSCAFFPVIRSAHKKELDLQQNSLISGCTCSTICISFLLAFRYIFIFIPEEKKSVISNFLIVIVFVLYCVPLWLFYDLFMKFMLFLLLLRLPSLLRALGTRGSLLCFLN